MVNAVEQDLNIRRGDTFPLTLSLNTDKNLTGAVVNAQAKRSSNSSTAEITWTDIAVVPDVGDNTNGVVDLSKSALETNTYAVGSYVYDVQVTFSDNSVYTIIEGKINVVGDITR
jgi:hypothetical protein